MARAQELLKASLPYLEFPEMRKPFKEFAKALVEDLDDAGYDESDEMAESTKKMQQALDDFDEKTATLQAEVKELGQEARELTEDEPEAVE